MPTPADAATEIKQILGIPISFWSTTLGAVLAVGGGFFGKLFTEYRDALAKDRQTLNEMHFLLAGMSTCLMFPTSEVTELTYGKKNFQLELEFRKLCLNVQCRRYRKLAAEAGTLTYDNTNNCQYMQNKLRSAINPKYFELVKRLEQEAIRDGRALDINQYGYHLKIDIDQSHQENR